MCRADEIAMLRTIRDTRELYISVSKELAARVDKRWSLSRLTFTHELARAVVLEQLYRAYTIVHGLPYQK